MEIADALFPFFPVYPFGYILTFDIWCGSET